MRARLGLLLSIATWVLVLPSGCARENPAFDEPIETEGQLDDSSDSSAELPPETGEEDPQPVCEVAGGVDMTIKVPQPCGETNDTLDVYEHWFHVVEAAGSTWTVQFCTADCVECEPLPGALEMAPLSVESLAGPGTCMLLTARRLGTGDDCNYHAVSVQDMSAGGAMLVLARRTELLDLPALDPATGLAGFEPGLVEAESCDCALTPDECCGGQAPTLYSYDVNGAVIPVGDKQPVTIGQRSYEFWAFDAFSPGACDAPIDVSWALVAQK